MPTKRTFAGLALVVAAGLCATPPRSMKLYVFDCATLKDRDPATYGLTRQQVESVDMSDPCFLIVHPRGTLLWETGLNDADLQSSGRRRRQARQDRQIPQSQLAAIGYQPNDITYLAMSHAHGDHSGNANDYAGSTWIVQKAERDLCSVQACQRTSAMPDQYDKLKDSKTKLSSPATTMSSATNPSLLISTPGHTPGHQCLLVRLPKTGPVLLSGDLFHFPGERDVSHHAQRREVAADPGSRAKIEALIKTNRCAALDPARYGREPQTEEIPGSTTNNMRTFIDRAFSHVPWLAPARDRTGISQAPQHDWPLVGGDWGNTRYSTLAQINPSNVKTLKGAWMARLNSGFGPGFSQQGTPVVKDGVMYITTGEQDIFALDAKTGNLIWEYRTPSRSQDADNKAKRGVALGEGMVFGVRGRHPQARTAQGRPEPVTRLFALDQKTGKTLWKHELGEDVPKNLRQYVAAPPLYYKGLVYMSISGGDGGLRGRLTAHDAKTGKEVWRWWAVPGPGEPGTKRGKATPGKPAAEPCGCSPHLIPTWASFTSNTGNPWPDYNGSARAAATTCSPARSWRWMP